MNKKFSLTKILGCGLLIFIGMCLLLRVILGVWVFATLFQDLKYIRLISPEHVPNRTVASMDGFSSVWSLNTEAGNNHLVYTQLFSIDEKTLVYATRHSLNSLDILTGKHLWNTPIATDTVFHLYQDKLFGLNHYDKNIPFVAEIDFPIPENCADSADVSSLSVYDPHTGQKIWEFSYRLVTPYKIYFEDRFAYLGGLTITMFAKYESTTKIEIDSGIISDISCINLNDYRRPSDDEGILSTNFYPITSERDWDKKDTLPFFLVENTKLKMLDRQTRELLGEIKFSGFPLNPEGTQLIIQHDMLIVYLDDSDQFFAFLIK